MSFSRVHIQTPVRALAFAVLASSAAFRTLPAQNAPPKISPPANPRPIALVADSIAVHGDSVAAFKMLDSVLRVNKRDGSVMHRYGMLAWSMARSSRGGAINHSRDGVKWLLAADSALHIATTFAPDSALFWRDLADFSLNSGWVFVRFRAQDYLRKGLLAATRLGDSLLIADLADRRGMVYWRRYEAIANRALLIDGTEVLTKGQIKHGVKDRHDQLVERLNTPVGFADYTEALNYFNRALNANRLQVKARQHLFMALAERKQWSELLKASDRQLAVAPLDFEAWLARGLASQRLDRGRDAAAAFDSALIYMTPQARAAYTAITRILPPKIYDSKVHVRDSATFAKLPKTEQEFFTAMLWATVDPLAATEHNEYRTEFYARVAYSDLRWTSDDLDYRGANTDRGKIYIRYGPPDRLLGQYATEVWRYNNGLSFVFDEAPTFGTAYDHGAYEQLKSEMPVSWSNVPITRLIDTMSVRLVTFRNTRDSVDVVVAADVPIAKMVHDAELDGLLPFDISTRVIDGTATARSIKSNAAKFNADSAPARYEQSWVQPVGAGVNVVRVDAYQRDTRRIAKGIANIDAARPTGFGMSDILLGKKLVNAERAPTRWRDVNVQPVFGTFRASEPIGLVWETYQLTPQNGDVHYQVNITVERHEGITFRRLAARVRSLGNALLGQSEGRGKIDIAFPRTAAAHDVTVESLTLDLGDPEPGIYRLRIEITDLASKAKTFRETEFRVVE